MRTLPEPLNTVVQIAFGLRRGWYRVRYPRLTMGRGVMIIGRLKVRQRTYVHIGDHTRIRQTVRISGGGVVRVGNDTLLNGVWIIASDHVDIGDRCLISDCGITDTDFHNISPSQRHDPPSERSRARIVIGENVWIGLSALVLKGVTIGENSVVGAGSVVRENVESGVVVVGDPPRVVKRF